MATVARAEQFTTPRVQLRVRLNAGFVAMTLVTLLVAFLVLFPLGMLLYGSFWTARPGFDGAFTLDNYLKAYTSLETYQVLATTNLNYPMAPISPILPASGPSSFYFDESPDAVSKFYRIQVVP